MRNYFSSEALSEPCWRNLFLGPAMGLAFIIYMPAVGFYLVGEWLVKETVRLTRAVCCAIIRI